MLVGEVDGQREFRRALQRALEAAGRRLCRTKLARAGQRAQHAQVAGGIVGSAIAQRNRNCEIGPRIVAQEPAYAAANRNQRDSVRIAIADVPLRLRPNDADTLDSRGFTFFKLGRFDDAITDCDAALKLQPKMASASSVRGLSKQKNGVGGDADVVAAEAIDDRIVAKFASYGVK